MDAGAAVNSVADAPTRGALVGRQLLTRAAAVLDRLLVPLGALALSLVAFGLFLLLAGHNPLQVYAQMYRGAFGTWFSVQNSLQRAAPLMLTGLCTALPARLGLIVIGGEGALFVGGVAAAAAGSALAGAGALLALTGMALAAMLGGALWIGAAGALRVKRGVNETISSLLLSYIGIAICNQLIEGPLRDPSSLNKPSTLHIGEQHMLGMLPGLDVHYGLLFGILTCVVCWILMEHSTFGFAARIVGGNARAARLAGLGVPRLVITVCALGGAAAGLAGMVEVAAVHGKANASLAAGYGYTGILVAFLARQHALAILPVAVVLGGINASGGLLQRAFDLPDATVSVLQGIVFVVVLASETYRGRVSWFSRRAAALGATGAT
jgi:simple sugar transport system permease protein